MAMQIEQTNLIPEATRPSLPNEFSFGEGDDGSLAFLGLTTDPSRKTFHSPAKNQTELLGKSFWVLGYFGNIQGKDGKTKYLFKAKFNLDDPEELAFKVWTGSPDIFFVLDAIGERNAFPRKVTLCKHSRGAMYFK